MDCLLMCGGQGTRLEVATEKPLYEVGGRPMIDRVRDALEGSEIETIYAVVSPATPATREHLGAMPKIETPGEGYVPDLNRALERVEPPVLTVAADLPLLATEVIDVVLEAHDAGGQTTCVPAAIKRLLGLSLDGTLEQEERELAPTGVNIVDEGRDSVFVTHDVRLAVNVNRISDAEIAEALL